MLVQEYKIHILFIYFRTLFFSFLLNVISLKHMDIHVKTYGYKAKVFESTCQTNEGKIVFNQHI